MLDGSRGMNGVLEKLSSGVFAKWQERAFELDAATAKLASKDPKKKGSKLKTVGTVVGARAVAAEIAAELRVIDKAGGLQMRIVGADGVDQRP